MVSRRLSHACAKFLTSASKLKKKKKTWSAHWSSTCFILYCMKPKGAHCNTGSHAHNSFTVICSSSTLCLLTSSHPTCFDFFPLSPCHPLSLSFWSSFLFHPSPPHPSSNHKRLICDWACCVFYRRLTATPGYKGHLKCHNVSIFCLCADVDAWEEADIQSSIGWRAEIHSGMDEGRQGEMRVKGGGAIVIDYSKSQPRS